MSRSFSAGSLVALPRVSGISAARLLQELIEAGAAEKKLPAAIAAERDELAAAYAVLHAELKKRLAAQSEDSAPVKAADRLEDNAFGALYDWLQAWTRLPSDRYTEASDAARVLATLYPSGLFFLTIAARDEWQEAETRFALLDEKKLDDVIESLGGAPFLKELKRAHEAYGKAPPAVREALDGALDAIRSYVLQVTALVKKSDPQSGPRAERLLAPLVAWKDRAPRASTAAPVASEPAPPAPPMPPTTGTPATS